MVSRTLVGAPEPDDGTAQARAEDASGVHEVQAQAEGIEIVGDGSHFEFMGERFRMADKIGIWPLTQFAMASKSGLDSDDMEGLAALYSLVRDCVDASEFARFEQHAIDAKADGEDVMKVVKDVIEVLSARPTRRPSDSSAGPPTTSEPSKVPSISRAPVQETIGDLVSITDLLQARSTG